MKQQFAHKKNVQTSKDKVFHCLHFHSGQVLNLLLVVSFNLQCISDRPLANMSKWSHFK